MTLNQRKGLGRAKIGRASFERRKSMKKIYFRATEVTSHDLFTRIVVMIPGTIAESAESEKNKIRINKVVQLNCRLFAQK